MFSDLTDTLHLLYAKFCVSSFVISIFQAKEQLYLQAQVSVESQRWDGWPQSVSITDDTILAACKLTIPVHNFTVTRTQRPHHSSLLTNTNNAASLPTRTMHSDSEDSNCNDYDMYDLDMDTIPSSSSSSRRQLS